ncbi:hypothetical protein D3C80_1474640 [compost metagenome]
MEQAKVRDAILRVVHPRRQPAHRLVAPRQPDQDLRVEIHAPAEVDAVDQRQRRGQRIHAKTAHRVGDRQRQAVDPHPHMRQVTGIQAALGHAVIVLRVATYQCLWTSLRLVEKTLHGGQIVLAIGVHLQRVAEAQPRRFAQPGHHCAAFALIGR